MPRFAANLSMLFTEVDFIDRFAAAARAGFRAVECQFPYVESAETIAAQLQKHDLQMVLHNLPAAIDWSTTVLDGSFTSPIPSSASTVALRHSVQPQET